MIVKEIDKITEADLQSLIDNKVSESKTIEYKEILKIGPDSEKKEFLADVSSFANAGGGDLIIGIKAKDGNPIDLLGIDIDDSGILKLESIIRDGIEPRLPLVVTQQIELANSKIVLVIRISKSWLSPHRVVFQQHDKFFSRSSNGKYPLDVSELRNAFLYTASLTDKIKRFKEDRISKVYANEAPVVMESVAKLILHILPLVSFNSSQRYEIEKCPSLVSKLVPLNSSGWDGRYNFEGFLTYFNQGLLSSYTQLYRNGIIEAVASGIKVNNLIPSTFVEEQVIGHLKSYLDLMKEVNVDLPYILFLTLVGVKDSILWVDGVNTSHKIDHEILQLPEVMVENHNTPAHTILRACFDGLWNASGFIKCFHYDDKGNWQKV